MRHRLAALAWCTLLILACATRAHANIEEFKSFDVAIQEEDDENLLDHFLTRMPGQWREDWDRSHGGFRAAEGCLTSGQWFMVNEIKTRASLGDRAWLDIGYLDVQDAERKYGWLQLEFRYPTRIGAIGWRFRPAYDKSSQDFALLYDWGEAASPLQIQAALTVEDMFNSLWEFRQTRVGNRSEPYRKHPFEPALRVIQRGAHHRLELYGQWLTPSVKAIHELDPSLDRTRTLWGEHGGFEASANHGPWTAELRLDQVQAYSTDTPLSGSSDSRSFRRRWLGELALRRTLGERVTAEVGWVHQERDQYWHPPLGEGRFRAVDRMPMAEVAWRAHERVLARIGTLYDRIAVEQAGSIPIFTWGTRKESRVFLGLQVRFGKVLLQGTECIELDREQYEVSFHHDKGFLHMQTTF
ncbi:MAG: hypothetical protein ABIU54_01245 [Candidatus Eisenbacteria bacterium]